MIRRNVFLFSWLVITAVLAWLLLQGNHQFGDPSTPYVLLGLLLCTVTLLRWLPNPIKEIPDEVDTPKHGWFILVIIVAISTLFLARVFLGPSLLYILPVLATGILVYTRPKISRKETSYAQKLALIAGLAGLGAGWVPFDPVIWAVLQVILVFSGLIAGWSLLQQTGLWDTGIGRSQYLDNGLVPAFRSLGSGVILSIPWALGLVLIGGADSQGWVQHWWQLVMAINPGIAEEAWGRILLIPMMFILFKQVFRPRQAYLLAMIIGTYWFAFLHTAAGVEGLISTLMTGTLFVLPITFICLHRNLETAIGFHFFIDFIKFLAAFFLNVGLGPG
jgi:hypothetical protein